MFESLIKGRLEMSENKNKDIEQKVLDRENEQDIAYKQMLSQFGTQLIAESTTTAHNALKMSLIINGGGAIAILTFIGNITTQSKLVSSLSECLFFFTAGVLMTAVSSGLTYLAQAFGALHFSKNVETKQTGGDAHPYRYWISTGLTIIVITLVIASYVYFYLGINTAASIFNNIGQFKDIVLKP